MKVKQLISKKSGNPIANQFIITTDKGLYFQSYNSIICFIDKTNDKIYLDPSYWNYSKTTSKYRNQFLNTNSQEINKLINSGIIKWKNLNS